MWEMVVFQCWIAAITHQGTVQNHSIMQEGRSLAMKSMELLSMVSTVYMICYLQSLKYSRDLFPGAAWFYLITATNKQ